MVLRKPRADSLLNQLWRVVMPVFQESLARHSLEAKGKEFALSVGEHRIRRLVASWNRPAAPEPVAWNAPEKARRQQRSMRISNIAGPATPSVMSESWCIGSLGASVAQA